MSYAIMRCAKLKQSNLNASLKHCYRTIKTNNADAELTPQNVHALANNEGQALAGFNDRLPEKRRKDAVVAVEYLMTASPEFFETATQAQQDDFFKNSMEWLCEKYGKKNIMVATIHKDEKTPHLSAFITPITEDGRLSAKELIGNKTDMSNDQTTFANAVEHLGLIRGVEKSQATHKDIKTFYGELSALQDDLNKPRITAEDITPKTEKVSWKKKKIETSEELANSLNEKFGKPLALAKNQLVAKDKEAKPERKKVVELQKTVQTLKISSGDLSGFEGYEQLPQADKSKFQEQIKQGIDALTRHNDKRKKDKQAEQRQERQAQKSEDIER